MPPSSQLKYALVFPLVHNILLAALKSELFLDYDFVTPPTLEYILGRKKRYGSIQRLGTGYE